MALPFLFQSVEGENPSYHCTPGYKLGTRNAR